MNKKLKKNNAYKSQAEKKPQENLPPTSSNEEFQKDKTSIAEVKSSYISKVNETLNDQKSPQVKEKKEILSKQKNEGTLLSGQLSRNVETPIAQSVNNEIKIFQIYYESWQKDLLDPTFIPLDNSKSNSELREVDVFARLAKSDLVKDTKFWGALSWRFAEKTGMTGQDVLKEILANPNYDIYFCNPEPEYEALYHNLWLQGAPSHPQFLEICQSFFKAVGLPIDALISIEPSSVSSSANYFIASPKFWGLYLPWVQNLLNIANKKMPPQMRDLFHSNLADDKKLHAGSTYVPFVIERLLPIFLKTVGSTLKAHKLNLVEPLKKMDVHLRLLREMKDVAHRTNSPWLAACWVNYRNLYLTQTKGASWCKNYLRLITPERIIF